MVLWLCDKLKDRHTHTHHNTTRQKLEDGWVLTTHEQYREILEYLLAQRDCLECNLQAFGMHSVRS